MVHLLALPLLSENIVIFTTWPLRLANTFSVTNTLSVTYTFSVIHFVSHNLNIFVTRNKFKKFVNYIQIINEKVEYITKLGGGGGGGGGDQVPSAGLHVGGWVIFSPKNTVSTWY